MTFITFKRLLRLAPFAAALAIAIGTARPAASATCTVDLANCYAAAANAGSSWMMWAAGLDCELTYMGCVRDALQI